jgi:hypothetical protein
MMKKKNYDACKSIPGGKRRVAYAKRQQDEKLESFLF